MKVAKSKENPKRKNLKTQKFNHIEKRFNFKSLLVKMIAVFTLLIVIPLFLVGVVSISSSTNLLIGQMKSNIISSTSQTTKYFDIMLKTVDNFSIQLTNDLDIQNFNNKSLLNSGDENTNRTNIKNKLMNLTGTNRYLSSIAVVRSDHEVISVSTSQLDFSSSSINAEELIKEDWYNAMIQNMSKSIWINNYNIGDADEIESTSAVLAKMTPSPIGNNMYDFILIKLNLNEIINHLKQVKLGAGDLTYAITPTGNVISPKGEQENTDIESSDLIKGINNKVSKKPIGSFEMNYDGRMHIISYEKSESSGWTFFTLVPKEEVISKANQLTWKILLLGIVFVSLAIIIGIMFSLNINNSLTQLKLAMADAEKGVLSTKVKNNRKDEIGVVIKSFNSMVWNIRTLIVQSKEIMSKVNDVSVNLKNISNESFVASSSINSAVDEIANLTIGQTSELDKCVDATTELATKINEVVDNTIIMQDASKIVNTLTNNGISVIKELNTKTFESNQISNAVIKNINDLNNDVKNIKNILNVLNGISEETTLLSFNASIEAARAGDNGRGFAVVAGEIRKLAETSGDSTKEIEILIENIIDNVANSINLARKTEEAMLNQTQIVSEAGELFSKINNTINQLIENIQMIAKLVNDIDDNKKQVVVSIKNMFDVSEQNTAFTQQVNGLTQEQLASIEEMVEMGNNLHVLSGDLMQSMEKFKE